MSEKCILITLDFHNYTSTISQVKIRCVWFKVCIEAINLYMYCFHVVLHLWVTTTVKCPSLKWSAFGLVLIELWTIEGSPLKSSYAFLVKLKEKDERLNGSIQATRAFVCTCDLYMCEEDALNVSEFLIKWTDELLEHMN